MTDPHKLTLAQAAEAIRTRAITVLELTRHCMKRMEFMDEKLNAFLCVTHDTAMVQAREADKEIAAGNYRGPLHGIPVALKDLIDLNGFRTTAASRVFESNIPDGDAEVSARLRRAGAIFVGKTNLHEFAYGGSGIISGYGVTRNPWDTARITGGSSSGNAAAVSAGFCFLAIGTDTAGSIRLPAACCGIAGLKPTYGLVSAKGVVPLSQSLDHVGPMARTVGDLRIAMEVLANLEGDAEVGSPRIGVVRKNFSSDAQADFIRVFEKAITAIGLEFRHPVPEIEIPLSKDRLLQKAESYQYHKQFLADRSQLYDPQTLLRIQSGAEVSTDEIPRLQKELARFRADSERVFGGIDIVATLTTPVEPPLIADLKDSAELRPTELLMLRNTRPFNVLGWPTLTLPCGLTDSGMPVGLQLAAAPNRERYLLAVAERCEKVLGFPTAPREV